MTKKLSELTKAQLEQRIQCAKNELHKRDQKQDKMPVYKVNIFGVKTTFKNYDLAIAEVLDELKQTADNLKDCWSMPLMANTGYYVNMETHVMQVDEYNAKPDFWCSIDL
jgi:hypothetical protein